MADVGADELVPSLDVCREAVYRLARAYSDQHVQRELDRIRKSGDPDFFGSLRALLLPVQVPVLEFLGLTPDAAGVAALPALLLQHVESEGDAGLELLRGVNNCLKLVKLPPLPCKRGLKDPMRKEPIECLRQGNALRRNFWLSICPWLHVSDVATAGVPTTIDRDAIAANRLDRDDLSALPPDDFHSACRWFADDLATEGYFEVPAEWLHWNVDVAAVGAGIARLASAGLPPIYILVYDEPWLMAAQLQRFAQATTGWPLVFDWSAFCLKSTYKAGGDYTRAHEAWRNTFDPSNGLPPHRGRALPSSRWGTPEAGYWADKAPRCATFWVALTDSFSENSCHMVVPRSHDPDYDSEEPQSTPLSSIFRKPDDFQNIRAVPLAAGGIACFSDRLCHWDAAPDPRAPEPRISLAVSAVDSAYEQPCLAMEPGQRLPPLSTRVALACAQVLRQPDQHQAALSTASRIDLFWELYARNESVFSDAFRGNLAVCKEAAYACLATSDHADGKEVRTRRVDAQESLFQLPVEEERQAAKLAELPQEHRSVPRLLGGTDPLDMLQRGREDSEFWRQLCPWLHVCDKGLAHASLDWWNQCARSVGDSEVDDLSEHLLREGYFSIPSGAVRWIVDVAGVARGVQHLVNLGLPAICIVLYDEPWVMSAQMTELAFRTSGGNEQAFDWSAFCVRAEHCGTSPDIVAPPEVPAGWPPHRDRGSNKSAVDGWRKDGTPRYITLWVPMTDATPKSSCLTIMPRRRDPGYRRGDDGASEISYLFRSPEDFQYIRALPLAAGGILAFNHRLFHWGTRADPRAEAPRIAMAFTATDPSFEASCFANKESLLPLPPLGVRVALVAAQLLRYAFNDEVVTTPHRATMLHVLFSDESVHFNPDFVTEVDRYHFLKHDRLSGHGTFKGVASGNNANKGW